MGFFDKLSKTVSETSTQIGQKTKSTANDLKLKKQAKEDTKYIKGCILDRFDIKWLKNMCKYYKAGEPDHTKYNWQTGNTNKVRINKSHWVEHCQAKLSLDQVKQYAKSHSVKISDLEREEEELRQMREAEHNKKKHDILNPGATEIPEPEYDLRPVSFIQEIITSVEDFYPARNYKEEKHYQFELNGWLKKDFPSSDIEVHKGHSRPDIVIDNVAIEIKGPTNFKDLETIFGKAHRYLQDYEHMIVVLFSVDVPEDRYENWKEGINQYFPDVVILRK